MKIYVVVGSFEHIDHVNRKRVIEVKVLEVFCNTRAYAEAYWHETVMAEQPTAQFIKIDMVCGPYLVIEGEKE